MKKYLILILILVNLSPVVAEVFSSVSGRIVDAETGKGIGNVRVSLYMYGIKMEYPPDFPEFAKGVRGVPIFATTDKTGFFKFEKVYKGINTLHVDHKTIPPPYAPKSIKMFDGSENSLSGNVETREGLNVTDLKITLRRGGKLEGYVRDQFQRPIVKAELTLRRNRGGGRQYFFDPFTDSTGYYSFGYMLPFKEHKILVKKENVFLGRRYDISVNLLETTREDFMVSIDSSKVVRGQLVDSLNQPIKKFSIFLQNIESYDYSLHMMTDSLGRYDFYNADLNNKHKIYSPHDFEFEFVFTGILEKNITFSPK